MIFYRYDDPLTDGCKAWERTFTMVKETPCGWWIVGAGPYTWGEKKRWVSKTARKRFAYPTKEEAWTSYKMRKKRQVQIYEARLRRAKAFLCLERPEIIYRDVYKFANLLED